MFYRIKRRLSKTWRTLRTGHAAPAAGAASFGEQPIPSITAEEVAEIKTFFPMEKFFVFGHARSGTTLLSRLIRVHGEIHCDSQTHFFTRPPLLRDLMASPEVRKRFAHHSNHWNRGQDLAPSALRAMADFILEREARRLGKTIVGDKSPNVALGGQAVRELAALYPDARLIYIVRDGRDMVISHRFKHFISIKQGLPPRDEKIRADFAHDPEPYLNGERSLFAEGQLRETISSWVDNVQTTDKLGREIFGDHYHLLKYEELLKDSAGIMSALWQFLGVDPAPYLPALAEEMTRNPDAAWQEEKASELVSALQRGKAGTWRTMLPMKDRQIVKEIAGQALIDWGYEQDLDW